MQPGPQLGDRASVEIVVDESMCPAFDGVVVHRVLSTWTVGHRMEIAARLVLAPHLEPHEEGIGGHLSIDHVAPAVVGQRVRFEATAVEVGPSTLVCDVVAERYDAPPGAAVDRDTPRTVVARGRQVQRILPRVRLAAIFERAACAGRPAPSRSDAAAGKDASAP